MKLFAMMAALILSTTPAYAQTAPITKTIDVVFTGTVSNDVTGGIQIRDPNTNTYSTYNGPMPNYPLKQGDPVTISFQTAAPTAAFYGPNGPGRGGGAPTDGIYNIGLAGPALNQPGSSGGFIAGVGLMTNFNISVGGVSYSPSQAMIGSTGLQLAFDSNAGSYSLNMPSGSWTLAGMAPPAMQYDSATNTIITCGAGSACTGGKPATYAGFNADQTSMTSFNIPIYGTDTTGVTSGAMGFFNLLFGGSWNMPFVGSSTNPTDVPEPSMILLFAMAVGGLVWRRRRAFIAVA